MFLIRVRGHDIFGENQLVDGRRLCSLCVCVCSVRCGCLCVVLVFVLIVLVVRVRARVLCVSAGVFVSFVRCCVRSSASQRTCSFQSRRLRQHFTIYPSGWVVSFHGPVTSKKSKTAPQINGLRCKSKRLAGELLRSTKFRVSRNIKKNDAEMDTQNDQHRN